MDHYKRSRFACEQDTWTTTNRQPPRPPKSTVCSFLVTGKTAPRCIWISMFQTTYANYARRNGFLTFLKWLSWVPCHKAFKKYIPRLYLFSTDSLARVIFRGDNGAKNQSSGTLDFASRKDFRPYAHWEQVFSTVSWQECGSFLVTRLQRAAGGV